MSWKGYLKSKPIADDDGMIRADIEFREDGQEPKTETVRWDRFTKERFVEFVAEREATLNFTHEVDAVAPGMIDTTRPEPSQLDNERQAYINDLILWRQLKIVGEFKPAVLTSKQFTDVEKRLSDNFKPAFLELI